LFRIIHLLTTWFPYIVTACVLGKIGYDCGLFNNISIITPASFVSSDSPHANPPTPSFHNSSSLSSDSSQTGSILASLNSFQSQRQTRESCAINDTPLTPDELSTHDMMEMPSIPEIHELNTSPNLLLDTTHSSMYIPTAQLTPVKEDHEFFGCPPFSLLPRKSRLTVKDVLPNLENNFSSNPSLSHDQFNKRQFYQQNQGMELKKRTLSEYSTMPIPMPIECVNPENDQGNGVITSIATETSAISNSTNNNSSHSNSSNSSNSSNATRQMIHAQPSMHHRSSKLWNLIRQTSNLVASRTLLNKERKYFQSKIVSLELAIKEKDAYNAELLKKSIGQERVIEQLKDEINFRYLSFFFLNYSKFILFNGACNKLRMQYLIEFRVYSTVSFFLHPLKFYIFSF